MGIAYPIEAGAEAQGFLRGRFVAQTDKKRAPKRRGFYADASSPKQIKKTGAEAQGILRGRFVAQTDKKTGAEAQGILRGRFVAQADKKTGAEAPVKSTLICR
jgi:hypothetical protein